MRYVLCGLTPQLCVPVCVLVQVDLPDVASDQVMLLCWKMLVEQYKQRFDLDARRSAKRLLGLSGRTPAMLCYLMEEWSAADFPRDITSFVLGHIKEKLLIEVRLVATCLCVPGSCC